MDTDPLIEILILNLRPGKRDEFNRLYSNSSIPLQKKWNIDVIAHGPSFHDENSYFVVRSFRDLKERKDQTENFSASDEWQKGPRNSILTLIESMSSIVTPKSGMEEWLKNINSEVTA
jgi:hypothetical protein